MTFDDFYSQEYLERHTDRRCRRLHLLGLLASAGFLGGVIWLRVWWLLLFVPVPCYALSWFGHFIAGNKPTAYARPLWSFRAYWRMIADTALGRLTALDTPATLPPDGLPTGPAVPSPRPG
jgi:hypothetical protein